MISFFQPYPFGSEAKTNFISFNWSIKTKFGPSIPGIDGPNLNLLDQLKDLEFTLACEPNGYGWKNEINKLINNRELS